MHHIRFGVFLKEKQLDFPLNSEYDYCKLYNEHTIGSKINRALEISRVKKLIANAILSNKNFSSHNL